MGWCRGTSWKGRVRSLLRSLPHPSFLPNFKRKQKTIFLNCTNNLCLIQKDDLTVSPKVISPTVHALHSGPRPAAPPHPPPRAPSHGERANVRPHCVRPHWSSRRRSSLWGRRLHDIMETNHASLSSSQLRQESKLSSRFLFKNILYIYMYICVCMYGHMYVYAHVHVYMYISISV